MKLQRGGFMLGLVVGLLIGLAVALGVALYITKTPVPFINKVPPHSADQDNAELEHNRNWDPNAALTNKITAGVAAAASGVVTAASAPAAGMPILPPPPAGPVAPAVKPAAAAARPASAMPVLPSGAAAASSPAADAFDYFVQAGAFTRSEDAEQQRAKLGLLGQEAKVTSREQAGRAVFRVRMGPFETPADANAVQLRLQDEGVDARIVRVQKP